MTWSVVPCLVCWSCCRSLRREQIRKAWRSALATASRAAILQFLVRAVQNTALTFASGVRPCKPSDFCSNNRCSGR